MRKNFWKFVWWAEMLGAWIVFLLSFAFGIHFTNLGNWRGGSCFGALMIPLAIFIVGMVKIAPFFGVEKEKSGKEDEDEEL